MIYFVCNMNGKSYKILICDDSIEIRELIGIYLNKEGWETGFAENGKQAVDMTSSDNWDLLILDIMMPVLDGINACLAIREFSNIPILFLTAKDHDDDKILGLASGADDYLPKPFNPVELTARVKAMLRRYRIYNRENRNADDDNPETAAETEGIRINKEAARVFVDGNEVKLTPTEYSILLLLYENREVLFSIDRLLDLVWEDVAVSRNTAIVHIRKLREKIGDDPKNPRFIKTVWGMGYRME